MWLVVNATSRPLYPREIHGTHCIGGWVGPRAVLDRCGISRHYPYMCINIYIHRYTYTHTYINTRTYIMPLPTEYCKNTCLQDMTVNLSVSTPPIHIGHVQVVCTSHCRYQMEVTGLFDTKSNKLSVTINSSVAVTVHFSSLIITFPTLFPIILDLQRTVASVSAGSWFHSLIVLFTKQSTDICSLFPGHNCMTMIIHDHRCSGSVVLLNRPFCCVCFEQGANSNCLLTQRQDFLDRIVCTVCEF